MFNEVLEFLSVTKCYIHFLGEKNIGENETKDAYLIANQTNFIFLMFLEEVCKLPETRGNCRAMMTRWRYSPELKEYVQK